MIIITRIRLANTKNFFKLNIRFVNRCFKSVLRFFFLRDDANVDVFSSCVDDENHISIVDKRLKIFEVFLFFDDNETNESRYSNLILSLTSSNAITFSLFFLL